MNRFLAFLILVPTLALAQVSITGGPKNWNSAEIDYPIYLWHAYGFDLPAIQKEDAKNDLQKDHPWRFGYKYDVQISKEDGYCTEMTNGDKLWEFEIACPGAMTINLLFENYHLPKGAEIHLYDKMRTNYVGAYTASNNRPDGMLGTELVHGESIIVEYYEPVNVEFDGSFTISAIVYGYRSLNPIQQQLMKALNDSGDCEYDVECPIGNGWEDEIRSVAMIIVNGNGVCTGALINNTCEDGRPLLLTANHCLTSSTANWAFRFNWKTAPGSEACATTGVSIDPGPPYNQTANGATVLVNGTQADHALLELDNLTPTNVLDWNLFFSGWDRSDNETVLNGTVIHHPKGDVMKISKENDAPYHNTISTTSVWWIDQYEYGVTEVASSGSPLYDQNHRIIGQLYGGTASCSGTNPNSGSDYYGRLGIAWNNGFDTILAPASCADVLMLDGWEPDAPDVFDDANLQFINYPESTICSDKFIPEVILRNAGDNNLTSCVIRYAIDGGTVSSQNWSGNLAPNGFDTITLPQLNATAGLHTLTVYSDLPNGVVDNNHVNDTNSVAFTLVPNTVETHIVIETDCYGYETAWEVHDSGSSLFASGGNPGVTPGGSQTAVSSDPYSYANEVTIDEKLCLIEGCYTFTIYDDWGDGIEGTTQSGCNVDGNYTISDEVGIVGSLQNVAFGVSETINFCVEKAGLSEIEQTLFSIYPNPTTNSLNIRFNQAMTNETPKYYITDVSGKNILSSKLIGKSIDISNLSQGTYFIQFETVTFPISFIVL